jgi:2-polyprenyl-3-methyl-5-hydroxy-6-metoxy-1,4-benzoquinol methylase
VSESTPEDPGRIAQAGYALERTEHELDRLTLQDELLGDSTRSLFERAGIGDGMRVLEVGSGAGDVALALAGMVGAAGSVAGVELDQATAEAAGRRIAETGIGNVEILAGDIASLDLKGQFDAVMGRLVLMHVPDPVAVLTRLRTLLRPGGIAAFQESHLASPWLSTPGSPTLELVERIRQDALAKRYAAYAHMGLALRGTFVAAGFPEPHLMTHAMVGGGPGWPGYRYIEATVRGLLPMWHRSGAEGVGNIAVDGMAERIEHEVGEAGSVLIHTLVGAWATAPDTGSS